MIRLLHTADIHIGVENYSRTDPTTGLPTRLLDFLKALDEAVDYAVANEVDLFVVSGDAYKSRDPSQTHQRELAKRVARLVQEGIAVFLLVGNHDLPNAFGRATSLEIFETLPLPNVTVGASLQSYTVETRKGPVQVVALPWVRRGGLFTGEETRGLTFEEINQRVQDLLATRLLAVAQSLDPTLPAILSAHITAATATLSSERSMMLGTDYVLNASNLALPQFDYCALGHIHRTQRLWDTPPLIYSGSLQRVDFSEESDKKGFYVVDIDPNLSQGKRATDVRFEEVDARRFVTIDVSITEDDSDPTATTLAAISRHYIEDAVVRLRLKLPASQESGLRDSEVRQALEASYFVASIQREVERPERVRLGRDMAAEGLSPYQALERFFDSRETSAAQRQRLLNHARRLIEEETGGQGDPQPGMPDG